MAHHGHEVSLSTRLDLEHAEPVLGVVEGDALDKACQNLPGRRFQLSLRLAVH